MLMLVVLVSAVITAAGASNSCKNENWWSSFDKKGWSTCNNDKRFITGFYRTKLGAWNRDEIYRLEEAKCCSSDLSYRNERSECKNANWWTSLDKPNSWSVCPAGYFLNGLYRTAGQNLHNIEVGKCCKPVNHPKRYEQCYDENIRFKFDRQGWSTCTKAGFYVVGVYRGADWLHNIDRLRCCKMLRVKPGHCVNSNWWSSFDKKGWSNCNNDKLFITGFYRSKLGTWTRDEIYRLEEAKCCSSNSLYQNQRSECKNANWWTSLDKPNSWSVCPAGYFLNGLYRTAGQNLHNIEVGKCCKPVNHPNRYEDCYDENVRTKFDKQGWTTCSKIGYYVVGVFRDKYLDWLHNVDIFKCCKMWIGH
ncbi:Hypothetical predicted protein [Paramuricea clavata]|nr:Hypothetical predicted protein [Paramuricea clavata]